LQEKKRGKENKALSSADRNPYVFLVVLYDRVYVVSSVKRRGERRGKSLMVGGKGKEGEFEPVISTIQSFTARRRGKKTLPRKEEGKIEPGQQGSVPPFAEKFLALFFLNFPDPRQCRKRKVKGRREKLIGEGKGKRGGEEVLAATSPPF